MKLTIPLTTVKSRFLKTLPVGTIYKDPRNGHSYIIEEKKINECLSKTGVRTIYWQRCSHRGTSTCYATFQHLLPMAPYLNLL